MNLLILPVSFI